MFEPEPEELAQVQAAFGLHELAVEDAQTFHLRPKVELYGGDLPGVILRATRDDDDAEEGEVGRDSALLAPAFLINLPHGLARSLTDSPETRVQKSPLAVP